MHISKMLPKINSVMFRLSNLYYNFPRFYCICLGRKRSFKNWDALEEREILSTALYDYRHHLQHT